MTYETQLECNREEIFQQDADAASHRYAIARLSARELAARDARVRDRQATARRAEQARQDDYSAFVIAGNYIADAATYELRLALEADAAAREERRLRAWLVSRRWLPYAATRVASMLRAA